MTEKEEGLIAELGKAIERNDRVLVMIADMVVGLIREQYAKNVLSIEQEPLTADLLRRTNEQLMDRMVETLVEKARIEKMVPWISDDELAIGVRKSLERSVDEYLMGLREVTDGR